MNNVVTNEDAKVKDFLATIETMMTEITQAADNFRPSLMGTRFLNDEQLSNLLHVNRRTLQEYRNNGYLPYYKICGKIIYKESDIEKILQENLREAWSA
ncbi:MAG: helix-turn-helix domain-containing protein [Rikenellaceae bacterium]